MDGSCECRSGFSKSALGGCVNASLIAPDTTPIGPPIAPQEPTGAPAWQTAVIVVLVLLVLVVVAAIGFVVWRRRRAEAAGGAAKPPAAPSASGDAVYDDVSTAMADVPSDSAQSVLSVHSLQSAKSVASFEETDSVYGFPKTNRATSSSFSSVASTPAGSRHYGSAKAAAPAGPDYVTLASSTSTPSSAAAYLTLASVPHNADAPPVVYSALKKIDKSK